MKKLVFIVNQPFYGHIKTQEFIDVVLMAAAFDQTIDLVFEGAGALALKAEQDAQALSVKEAALVLASLPIYGIERVWLSETDANTFGIHKDNVLIDCKIGTAQQINVLQHEADFILTY